MRVMFCDDDAAVINEMIGFCTRYGKERGSIAEMLGVTSPESLLAAWPDFHPDLLFLDIEMPGCSGLKIKERLERESDSCLIYFLTGYGENMADAFGRNVIGFFAKPMTYQRFAELMEKAECLLSNHQLIEIEGGCVVRVSQIRYITVEDVYTEVCLEDGRRVKNIRRSMVQWEKLLPEGDFLRVSDACLIGCAHIRALQKGVVILEPYHRIVRDRARDRWPEAEAGGGAKAGSEADSEMPETFICSRRRQKGCQEKYRAYCMRMARYYRC